jgi:hypothetical protein
MSQDQTHRQMQEQVHEDDDEVEDSQMTKMSGFADARFPDLAGPVAFSKWLETPQGRAEYITYRDGHLARVGKSYGLRYGGYVAKAKPNELDDEDLYDDEEDALDECQKAVAKLVSVGVPAMAAWERVSTTPMFKRAKALKIGRGAG